MAATKTIEPPVTAPSYDPENLDDVLKRLRSATLEVKAASVDVGEHCRRHTNIHYKEVHGGWSNVAPAQDQALMGRLQTIQRAIGEYLHAMSNYLSTPRSKSASTRSITR